MTNGAATSGIGPGPARAAAPTEKGARQVEAILDATVQSIASRGYAATSLARIAEEAGTTKRMVLYYFESREHLFSELVLRIVGQMVAQSRADFDAAADPAEGVRVSLRHAWERVTGDPVLVRAYFAVLGEAGADPVLRELLDHVRAANLEVVALHIERAKERGIEPPLAPEILSLLMFAGFRGLLLEFYDRGQTPELEQAVALFEQTVGAAFAPR
ncbi:MAG: TetR/AcrR family transcriptional regulator [Solirubrobacteraceae bacterium]|nr:TetR/AcrR family transcriptional regulator [Solirubrobacteraceae bacterium]